ncbi:chorismate synthase [uncultured Gemmiger sp.]|uniref:chorismate synthase n=1 Tax=uncultured Gemmiger sp. TaxID=1623490 RepID=UPI0025CDAECA|nr:chorismate synthase [uncultured Gemmiger sp.]
MKNTFGSAVSLTIFGESHGPAIGAVLDGLAAGLPVDGALIAACMDRRRARGDGLSTSRTEPDQVEFVSGVLEGRTTGTPVTLLVRNTNTRSGDYAKTAALLRPGHADYTAWVKYEGFQDARGGGHFSGRITAASVAAGAICQQVLAGLGVQVYTHIARCAGISDAPLPGGDALPAEAPPGHFALIDPSREVPMQEAIRAAGAAGDSVGGVLETVITGLPAGVGEPFFDSVESELAHLMFAIPAVKGIEFGAGFRFADLTGSTANDAFRMGADGGVVTATNRNGGVNGGITNGMPVIFRTVVKPTPSIYKEQQTVDFPAKTDAQLVIHGRHDPCIVPRAAVVQNTLAAFGLLDLITVRYGTLAQKHGLPDR